MYQLLCATTWLLALPFLAALSLKQKHRRAIPARFFAPFSKNFKLDFAPTIWIHACSLGEMRSLSPIITALKGEKILLTATTQTGHDEAMKFANENIQVRFLPFEIFLPLWKKYLKNLKTLVVTEAELWKNLFDIAKNAGAKTMLINARISRKSYPNYRRFAFFYTKIFSNIDVILAQSAADVERFKAFGAAALNYGNLKTLSAPKTTKNYKKTAPLIIAASTHESEEELVLDAFLSAGFKDEQLAIAPRHPERFEKVAKMLDFKNQNYTKLSQIQGEILDLNSAKILLVDKIGELNNLYAIADAVVLGGSFVSVGGHNPMEPAFFGARLISGKEIFNQLPLFALVENALLIDEKELQKTLKNYKKIPNSSIKKSKMSLEDLVKKIKEKA